jgi:hypothetical protein
VTFWKNTTSKVLAAAGPTAALAVGTVVPSSAGTNNRAHHSRAYGARAYSGRTIMQAPAYDLRAYGEVARKRNGGGYFAHGAPDDPPGSAYQSFGNNQSIGLPR